MDRDQNVDDVVNGQVQFDSKVKIRKPKMYRVVLFNDDYTTMEFVIDILISIFNKPATEATKIMLDVHKRGAGICGVYTYDIALTKVKQVLQKAKSNEFPLRCDWEEA